jgi:hypothetical protein
MLKLKKGLTNVLEETSDDEYTTDESQLQPVHDSRQITSTQVQPMRQVMNVQPRPATHEWEELLIKLLATAPEDVAYRLVNCLDTNLLIQMLEGKKNDPYLRVALLLLKR